MYWNTLNFGEYAHKNDPSRSSVTRSELVFLGNR